MSILEQIDQELLQASRLRNSVAVAELLESAADRVVECDCPKVHFDTVVEVHSHSLGPKDRAEFERLRALGKYNNDPSYEGEVYVWATSSKPIRECEVLERQENILGLNKPGQTSVERTPCDEDTAPVNNSDIPYNTASQQAFAITIETAERFAATKGVELDPETTQPGQIRYWASRARIHALGYNTNVETYNEE